MIPCQVEKMGNGALAFACSTRLLDDRKECTRTWRSRINWHYSTFRSRPKSKQNTRRDFRIFHSHFLLSNFLVNCFHLIGSTEEGRGNQNLAVWPSSSGWCQTRGNYEAIKRLCLGFKNQQQETSNKANLKRVMIRQNVIIDASFLCHPSIFLWYNDTIIEIWWITKLLSDLKGS